jgi:hypothetical protein
MSVILKGHALRLDVRQIIRSGNSGRLWSTMEAMPLLCAISSSVGFAFARETRIPLILGTGISNHYSFYIYSLVVDHAESYVSLSI